MRVEVESHAFLSVALDVKGLLSSFDVYWTVHHLDNCRNKIQLDATCYFIMLMLGSTCFGHHYAHAATREPDGLCGNQRYRRELLTMGIMLPETC